MSQIGRPRVNTGRLIGSTAGMADTGRTSWTGYRVHGRYRGDPVGRPIWGGPREGTLWQIRGLANPAHLLIRIHHLLPSNNTDIDGVYFWNLKVY